MGNRGSLGKGACFTCPGAPRLVRSWLLIPTLVNLALADTIIWFPNRPPRASDAQPRESVTSSPGPLANVHRLLTESPRGFIATPTSVGDTCSIGGESLIYDFRASSFLPKLGAVMIVGSVCLFKWSECCHAIRTVSLGCCDSRRVVHGEEARGNRSWARRPRALS